MASNKNINTQYVELILGEEDKYSTLTNPKLVYQNLGNLVYRVGLKTLSTSMFNTKLNFVKTEESKDNDDEEGKEDKHENNELDLLENDSLESLLQRSDFYGERVKAGVELIHSGVVALIYLKDPRTGLTYIKFMRCDNYFLQDYNPNLIQEGNFSSIGNGKSVNGNDTIEQIRIFSESDGSYTFSRYSTNRDRNRTPELISGSQIKLDYNPVRLLFANAYKEDILRDIELHIWNLNELSNKKWFVANAAGEIHFLQGFNNSDESSRKVQKAIEGGKMFVALDMESDQVPFSISYNVQKLQILTELLDGEEYKLLVAMGLTPPITGSNASQKNNLETAFFYKKDFELRDLIRARSEFAFNAFFKEVVFPDLGINEKIKIEIIESYYDQSIKESLKFSKASTDYTSARAEQEEASTRKIDVETEKLLEEIKGLKTSIKQGFQNAQALTGKVNQNVLKTKEKEEIEE